jgi:hypothetical protein
MLWHPGLVERHRVESPAGEPAVGVCVGCWRYRFADARRHLAWAPASSDLIRLCYPMPRLPSLEEVVARTDPQLTGCAPAVLLRKLEEAAVTVHTFVRALSEFGLTATRTWLNRTLGVGAVYELTRVVMAYPRPPRPPPDEHADTVKCMCMSEDELRARIAVDEHVANISPGAWWEGTRCFVPCIRRVAALEEPWDDPEDDLFADLNLFELFE